MNTLIPPVLGIVGLIAAFVVYLLVMQYPDGEKKVKKIGKPIETSKSLKKLISSKIFNMKANVKKIKTVLTNVNKNCLLI